MAEVGIVAIPKVRQIQYGTGGTLTQEQLTIDVSTFTRNAIIKTLREISASEMTQQLALGNPPDIIVTDGRRGKPAFQAVRRVEVSFGSRLPTAALSVVEDQLRKSIGKATERRTGTLSSMSNWRWIYIRDGRGQPVPVGAKSGILLNANDSLVLRPERVPHSTVANIAVAGQRRARAAERRIARGKGDPNKARGSGFLAQTTRALRRHPLFAGFRVVVRFTRYAVSGEKWRRRLTGTIMITPERGRGARRRRR